MRLEVEYARVLHRRLELSHRPGKDHSIVLAWLPKGLTPSGAPSGTRTRRAAEKISLTRDYGRV